MLPVKVPEIVPILEVENITPPFAALFDVKVAFIVFIVPMLYITPPSEVVLLFVYLPFRVVIVPLL